MLGLGEDEVVEGEEVDEVGEVDEVSKEEEVDMEVSEEGWVEEDEVLLGEDHRHELVMYHKSNIGIMMSS